MKVRGKEIKFLRTVKTTCDLVELCPDKDINRAAEIFDGDASLTQKNAAILIHSLNEGYEMNKHFDNPEYEPQVLSVEEIMYLDNETFTQLLQEAIKIFSAELEPTVEAEKGKKKKKTV